MIFIAVILVFFFVIAVFSFPQFSPIPYFPSNKHDLKIIIKSLQLRNAQTVIDLGAGDGMVILEAADLAYRKKLNTAFIAVEINPILLLIMHIRRLFHPNRNNISVLYGNMFTLDYSFLKTKLKNPNTVFYIYISPWYIEKTLTNIAKQCRHFSLVSYMYPVKRLVTKEMKTKGTKHDIYVYTV